MLCVTLYRIVTGQDCVSQVQSRRTGAANRCRVTVTLTRLCVPGTISADRGNKQVLDRLQVEQERGITVKAQTASLFYTHVSGSAAWRQTV